MATSPYKESNGRAVDVTLSAGAEDFTVLYADGFLGILQASGNSGETRSLNINSGEERQFRVPDGLSVSKGDTVYVDITDVTGQTLDDSAFSTNGAGTTPKKLFKATADKDTSGGAGNHWVSGILLPDGIDA